jgi:hypothetical protein
MKNLLLTVLAFGLFSSSAFAEEQPQQEGLQQKQFTRVIASGEKARIGFFYAVHPDCTASGDVNNVLCHVYQSPALPSLGGS